MKLVVDVPCVPNDQGFVSIPSNRVHVVFSDGTEKLCAVGHRNTYEEVTLPDGRVSTVKVPKLWVRVLADEAPAPAKPAAKPAPAPAKPAPKAAKAPKAPKAEPAPAPDPMAQLTTILGSLLQRVEALEKR